MMKTAPRQSQKWFYYLFLYNLFKKYIGIEILCSLLTPQLRVISYIGETMYARSRNIILSVAFMNRVDWMIVRKEVHLIIMVKLYRYLQEI